MASGLERGSRSANRLNHADMSLDPPEEAAIIPDFSQLWVQNKPFFSLQENSTLLQIPAELTGWGAGWFWPMGGCRGGAWNIGGVTQPMRVRHGL